MTDNIIYENERLDNINEDLRLIQKKNGLTYGTDAYLLAAYIRATKNARAAELGSGTGIISLLLAARKKLGKIYACEIQKEFAELCERNAEMNSLSDKIISLCADVRSIKSSDTDGELDVVFSNPPYMRADSGKRNQYDEKFIARHEVCGNIEDFCASASRLLKYGGLFYCVYRPDRFSDLFTALKKHKLEPKYMTFVHADALSSPSMALIEAKKGAATGLKISAPLILHNSETAKDSSRELLPQVKRIYETCSFEDFRKAGL